MLENSILVRNLIIVNSETGLKQEVCQLHVICWPDYLIPDDDKAFPMIENLIANIKNNIKNNDTEKDADMKNNDTAEDTNITNSPILIHCR